MEVTFICIYFKKYTNDPNFYFYGLNINIYNKHSFMEYCEIVMTFSMKNRHKIFISISINMESNRESYHQNKADDPI